MEICCAPERVLRAPGYREQADGYDPPEDLVAALREIARPATVLVVYGTWCNDSRRVVPMVIKALSVAANERLQFLAVHVAYAETDPSPFMAGPVAVSRYPTVCLLEGFHGHMVDIPADAERARWVEQVFDAEGIRSAV